MKLDRTTLIAVALCVLFLLFYPYLLRLAGLERYVKPAARPTPTAGRDSSAADTSARRGAAGPAPSAGNETAPAGAPASPGGAPGAPVLAPFRPAVPALERQIALEGPLYRAVFSSRGARLVSVELKRFASAHGVTNFGFKPPHYRGDVPEGDRVVLAGGPTFGLDLGSGASLRSLAGAVYDVAESLDAAGQTRALTFTARDSSGMLIRQTYRMLPDSYALDLDVELRGVPESWRIDDYSLATRSWPLTTESNPSQDLGQLRATSLVGTNVHREHGASLVGRTKSFDGNAEWAAVQSRYFVAAVAAVKAPTRGVVSSGAQLTLPPDQLARMPADTKPVQPLATNALVVGMPGADSPVHRFALYVGPSDYFQLSHLKLGLERIVDLGWTWVQPFSRALLRLFVWLHDLVRNYGVAIVVLATLVRVLLHPLNMSSMKSMRAMQKIQPEVERIRQKYKNDATAMNNAIMALYKENKVNPAGGCLPMLVQMPLFIALYSVLFNAIELRQAPFAGWIHDLSAPDVLFQVGPFPIRLLPLVMAGSGFWQQKLTPTDPRQAPNMYLMNAFMLVLFYNLPSGLVLYWTVMNLLTVFQQWMVLRQDGDAQPAVVVVPTAAEVAGSKRRRGRK